PRRTFLHLAAGAAALPAVTRIAWAQAYPTRPVRIIVGQAAGSGSDTVARLIGQFLSERLGQQFVIENPPGAGGNIATETDLRSPPDGYTLLLLNSSNTINATSHRTLPALGRPRDRLVRSLIGSTRKSIWRFPSAGSGSTHHRFRTLEPAP